MSSLLGTLQQGARGLAAHRGASDVASTNLQNVNTPGYARQRAELVTVSGTPTGNSVLGGGVHLRTVAQLRDAFIERQLPQARADRHAAQGRADGLSTLALQEPSSSESVASRVASFFNAMRQLSAHPQDTALRQTVLSEAQHLSRSVRREAQSLTDAAAAIDARLGDQLPRVNELSASIVRLNRAIREASTQGTPNELLDQRQRAVDELSELTGIIPLRAQNGDVTLSLPSGVALVSSTGAATLRAQPDPANNGHTAIVLTKVDGNGSFTLSRGDLGGTLRGLMDARDVDIAAAATNLDNLAFQFGSAVNAAHGAGFAPDGTTGRGLFVVGATAAGSALNFTVDAAVAGNPAALQAASALDPLTGRPAAGDGRNALALLALERSPLPSGAPPATTAATLVGNLGNAIATTKGEAEATKLHLDHLHGLREQASGVSVDEEMVELMRSQRAFEAVSKVIKTADDMLNTLLGLKQ
jgi:flagellar hook-associated protein 1 FlgK